MVSNTSLTLEQVSGQELCIGTIPNCYLPLCNHSMPLTNQSGYLVPANDTWWSCSFGLTPWAHVTLLNRTKGFCVLVCLVLRVTYHAAEESLRLSEATQYALRQKRELVTAFTLAILMGTSLAESAADRLSSAETVC